MTWFTILAQGLGFIGAGIVIGSFQCRSLRRLLFWQMLSAVFFTAHFALLGQWTGAIMNVGAIVRAMICSSVKPWARSRLTLIGMLVAFLAVGVLTWAGWISILPTAAMLVSTWALFTRKQHIVRISQISVTSPFWLIYNFAVGSISGVITESFNLVSVAVSLIRFRKGDVEPPALAQEDSLDEKARLHAVQPDHASDAHSLRP